jgi:hypothetical protein
MATVTKLVDDIDGSDATDTLEFSWGGDNYTIDLNDVNADEFRTVMALYVSHATKVRHEVKAPTKRSGAVRSTSELNEIRSWARANGYEVASIGRIREEVITAYENRETSGAPDEDDNAEREVLARITKDVA